MNQKNTNIINENTNIINKNTSTFKHKIALNYYWCPGTLYTFLKTLFDHHSLHQVDFLLFL